MKSRLVFALTAVGALCLCPAAYGAGSTSAGATPSTVATRLAEGIRLHNAARQDAANLASAKATLAAIKDESPVALAYYGSIVTLEASAANDRKDALGALALLKEGTALIDAAVKKAPLDAEIRFLRMGNSYEVSVSSPVNRFKEMKADIDWLTERSSGLGVDLRAELELYRGLYLAKAHRLDEAIAAFEKCAELAPGSSDAAEAQRQLARYAE